MGLYIIMMGVQGAGKGVQAQFIKDTYGIPHISTGDMFRAMKTREDELAKRVQDIMKSGALVDDDTTNAVVEDRLSQDDAKDGVILDGYPRNQAQAEFLEQLLAKKGEKLTAVILMELDLFVAFKRAFGRLKDANEESYNIYYKNDEIEFKTVEHPEKAFPPRIEGTLKATGESLKRREDDADAAAVIKRIDTFLENTQPLIEYYEAKGVLKRVNADQPIEAVGEELKQVIDSAKA